MYHVQAVELLRTCNQLIMCQSVCKNHSGNIRKNLKSWSVCFTLPHFHFSRSSKNKKTSRRCCRCRRGVRCLRWPRVTRARLQRLPWPLPSHSPSTASCALATPPRQAAAAAAAAAATVAAAPATVRHPQAMRQLPVRVLVRQSLPSRSKCHRLPFRTGLTCPPLALAPPSLLMAFGGSTPPS